MAEKITGEIEEEEQQLASALSNSVENLTLESQGDSNNSNNEQQTSIAVEEIQPTTPSPPIEVATHILATPEVVDDVPLPLPPPQFDGSPTQKNDPQKRRNSYDYVESRLHQTTAATNSGKWQGKSSLSPQPTRNHIKQPLSTPDPSDLQNNHVYETPTAPSNATTSSHFKDIPSRLHETTVATSNGKWAKPSNGPADDLPKFNTSVRRASMGELMLPQEKEKATWKDPYKDSVQSRLFSPTIATTQGQWDHTHTSASAAGSEATPTDTPQSPNEKAKRRFSTSYIPSDTIPSHDLPSSGKSSPYGNVKTRLHLQTAAVKNAKWQNDKAVESQSPEGPRFVSTFGKKTTEFPSPAPSTPNSMHNEYKGVKTRLYEATAATEHAKYAGPEVSVDSSLPKFDTSVRRASMTSSDFSTPPPVPESRKYKDVASRLLAPTTASKEGGWKKEDERKSLSPETLTPPSSSTPPTRLLKPTVSSLHHAWPASPGAPITPPQSTGQPQLIKSKAYENVESRLLCPTASYLAKYTVVEETDLPQEAFGHPIEPEYQNLRKKSPRLSVGGGARAASGHSPSISRSSSNSSPRRQSSPSRSSLSSKTH